MTDFIETDSYGAGDSDANTASGSDGYSEDGTILFETPEGDFMESVDSDGDGKADVIVGYLNGIGDIVLVDEGMDGAEYVAIDGNGDGVADITIAPQEDGTFYVEIDEDSDGVYELTGTLSGEEIESYSPEVWAAIQGTVDDGVVAEPTDATPTEETAPTEYPADEAPAEEYPTVTDGQIVGDPFQYSEVWFEQSWNGSCVPASVAQIYNLYTGEDVSDLEFVELTNQIQGQGGTGGWIVGPDGAPGLPPATAVDLLEAAGIPATITSGSLDTLNAALEGGYGVMVAIDSGEVWYGEDVEDDAMDHMVVVSGIDYETNTVYLSDTGSPDGAMEAVPLDVFLDAWADSENLMVECTVSVDEYQSTEESTQTEVTPESDAAGTAAGGTNDDGVEPFSALIQAVVQVSNWILLPINLSLR